MKATKPINVTSEETRDLLTLCLVPGLTPKIFREQFPGVTAGELLATPVLWERCRGPIRRPHLCGNMGWPLRADWYPQAGRRGTVPDDLAGNRQWRRGDGRGHPLFVLGEGGPMPRL